MPVIQSINISPIVTVDHHGKAVRTGIFKKPTAGPVMVRTLGIEGDDQADRRHHGGPERAVYFYPAHHYDSFRTELHRTDLPLGKFGENVSITNLDESQVCIGDVIEIGNGAGPVIEVTSPRMPCSTLAMAMNDPQFPKAFLAAGRTGWYSRVLREGSMQQGDIATITHHDPAKISVRFVAFLKAFNQSDLDGARRALGVKALATDWQQLFSERLAKAVQP